MVQMKRSDVSSYLIRLHGGCNGSVGSRIPRISVATDTGPGTPRLLCSTPPEPPQTERWLLRSHLYRTALLLQWRSAATQKTRTERTEESDLQCSEKTPYELQFDFFYIYIRDWCLLDFTVKYECQIVLRKLFPWGNMEGVQLIK